MKYTPDELEKIYNQENSDFTADTKFINWLKNKGATIIIINEESCTDLQYTIAEVLLKKSTILIVAQGQNEEPLEERLKNIPQVKEKFTIENITLPELTMPYVNEKHYKDNRPFYQKIGKKKKYGI